MQWVLYKNWSGAVNGKQIRVPVSSSTGLPALGPSLSAIHLPVGTICRVINVFPANATDFPGYVKFAGHEQSLAYALEIEISKSAVPEHIWKQIINAHVSADYIQLVVVRKIADLMEIGVG